MNTVFPAAIMIAAALSTSCSGASAGDRPEALVFAAASLTNALEEAVDAYEQTNSAEIHVSYAGSQRLAHQIAGGAPRTSLPIRRRTTRRVLAPARTGAQ